jgi:hypothetical protein
MCWKAALYLTWDDAAVVHPYARFYFFSLSKKLIYTLISIKIAAFKCMIDVRDYEKRCSVSMLFPTYLN